ncbi:3-oxoadipate enol-lactone hydrolase/4-carboxymuconolactone decarboxylase [Streptococcus parasanguinis]|uniref:alpha/beta fold hydrolase n=1 Tax=Streptococcus parasanguinis TaxID=1318 RepID=UPI000776E4E7|nr:alpha/beta hydrolase [Streptococcus parasanguinis]KXT87936.1 3-oxoadipate enol-lactone hydrolase/4-carboxymuconolactone decarboxylase [Streptococcus parasanguinis]
MSSTKGKTLYFNEKSMDYVTFGKGNQPLVIIPGLGDGLQTVKGKTQLFSLSYRLLAKRYKIYVFSRINELRQGYTTRDMAADVAEAMEALNLDTAYVMGISQGGMIAQWLAADFPERVQKLILAVTTAKPSQLARERIEHWQRLSQSGTFRDLMLDIAKHSYTQKSYQKWRFLSNIMGRLGRIKDEKRIAIQSQSCLTHDSLEALKEIQCPTLILGALEDDVIGVDGSKELAKAISGCQLLILKHSGHALYEENKVFQEAVCEFLN